MKFSITFFLLHLKFNSLVIDLYVIKFMIPLANLLYKNYQWIVCVILVIGISI